MCVYESISITTHSLNTVNIQHKIRYRLLIIINHIIAAIINRGLQLNRQ